MRVLVTGITGFVGSHLADYILENHPDVEIYGLKRWRSPVDNIRHIEHKPKLIDGDLQDLSSMLSILRQTQPEMIFHLASQSFVPYSYSVPIETLTTNVIGTANLLEAVRALLYAINPRIHICSSPEVYGNPNEEDFPMKETCPLRPVSPYAVSKVAEDTLAYMYFQAYGLKTVTSRAFAHEGPRRGEPFAVSVFAKQIAMLEKHPNPTPTIYVGNLDSVRTYMDVRDTVRAYWLLLEKGKPGEVYNIAGDERMSLREVLNYLLSISRLGNVNIEVDKRLLRPKDVTLQIADDRKFRKLTGWKPEIPFQMTLQDTLDYWRERV